MSAVRSLLAAVLLAAAATATAAPKVVVLGFDGADAELTRKLMDEGRLPHLAKLAGEGAFRPLLPTNPPQTPVSWSTFATGLNPGRTEIFDFLKRRAGTYLPEYCAYQEGGRRPFLFGSRNGLVFGALGASVGLVPLLFALVVPRRRRALALGGLALAALAGGGAYAFATTLLPESAPSPVNNRKGETFWEAASKAGLRTRVLRVPLTFPADRLKGLTMLSGLGVPDMRGTNGQPTLYTTRAGAKPGQFAVKVVRFDASPGVPVETTVEGPRNLLFPPKDPAAPNPRLTAPLVLTPRADGVLTVATSSRTEDVAPGAWTDWHVVTFRFNALIRTKGMVRFYNQSRAGEGGFHELVMSPVHFHPDTGETVGWCHPGDYGEHLMDEVGLFKTMGWASDTWTVADELAAEEQSLSDVQFTTDGFEKLLRAELADPELDLYVQVFEFTDRIQHVFWRLTDPGHPGYDAALAEKHAGVVERAYERMDRIVGEARALAPDAVFVILSDHGFASFRRGVNINRWLVDHGYMVLHEDPCVSGGSERNLEDLFGNQARIFAEVDWSRTRAYAMGLGNVYVNLAGREPKGIVRPGEEYEQLLQSLSAGLEALVDEATGERPVHRVYRRDQSYSGYDPEVVPDLRVANSRNYRVSWGTSLGGIPCDQVEDNDKPWGGDHCSLDPEVVKGILIVNRPVTSDAPTMADMAPSLLGLLGVPPLPDADGKAVF